MKKKQKFRKIINTLHLWVGVPCALILFVVCVTGTTIAFKSEITRWVDRDLYKINLADGTPLRMKMDTLVHLLESGNTGLLVTAVQIPERNDEAWVFTLAPPARKNPEAEKTAIREKTRLLIVNPYDGLIKGDAQTTAYRFFATAIELHRWLLLDHSIGSIITGTAAFLFLLLEITGLILWLPAKLKSWKKWKAWRPGFSIKWSARWKRVNHDIHKTLGFYTFLFITVMAFTGPYFAFPWYREGVAHLMGAKLPKKEIPTNKEVLNNGQQNVISLENLLVQTTQVLHYPGDMRVILPKGQAGSFSIQKVRTGFFASAATDKIDFDTRTGKIKKLDLFKTRTTGEKIISLMKAIHTGEILGTFSKVFYFIACLLATSLPVTGILIWLNKRRKKEKVPHGIKLSTVQTADL